MFKFAEIALQYARRSDARDYKHGAVCVVGGKVASVGFNYSCRPHVIKVPKVDSVPKVAHQQMCERIDIE
jgi:deoxycytidylate deaminase